MMKHPVASQATEPYNTHLIQCIIWLLTHKSMKLWQHILTETWQTKSVSALYNKPLLHGCMNANAIIQHLLAWWKFMFIKEYVPCTRSSFKARLNHYHIREVRVVVSRVRKKETEKERDTWKERRREKQETADRHLQKKSNWPCHDSFMFYHTDPEMHPSPVEKPLLFHVQFQGQAFKKKLTSLPAFVLPQLPRCTAVFWPP